MKISVEPKILIDHGRGSWALGVVVYEGRKRLAIRANDGCPLPKLGDLLRMSNGWILLPEDYKKFLRELELATKSY